jgi:hypothetical protein
MIPVRGVVAMKKISKELLGLAGEYAVASELCKQGIYAQLTLGHHKRTDILVETDYKMLRIQVKTKQGYEWPAISGIYSDDDILVLVDFKGREETERAEFYILDIDDWEQLLKKEEERVKDVKIDRATGTILYPDGWQGLNVKPSQIPYNKEQWEKITSKLLSD